MSVRSMRKSLDATHSVLTDLRDALKKQYWYVHPMKEGLDVHCYLCGKPGKEHVESPHGYLCPLQPSAPTVPCSDD